MPTQIRSSEEPVLAMHARTAHQRLDHHQTTLCAWYQELSKLTALAERDLHQTVMDASFAHKELDHQETTSNVYQWNVMPIKFTDQT